LEDFFDKDLFVFYHTDYIDLMINNSSTTLKKAFFTITFIIAALLVYTPAGAAESWPALSLSGENSPPSNDSSDNHSGNPSRDVGLILSLTRSLSLDLRLGSVDTGQAPIGQKEVGAPPIPISKAPGSDLRYSRLGVGFVLGF